jgi:molybdopterin-guanine dinucleotide biosynthesis protein A
VTAPLTGVLLVGGASERFGSPKALATFRGESLATRGRRLLAEACDEVLVVGKAVELPFDVVDDGAEGRAPVHGVVAGLRNAAHETVVVLPVDVPLVTPGALRALGAAGAVPSARIPLPGAYPRPLLPVLEGRVRAGELSLRGVNTTTLAVPEGLLVDVDTPEELAELERPGHALVVGGTGMLAALTRSLAERGHVVTSVARRATLPPDNARNTVLQGRIAPLALDYRDGAHLRAGLARAVAERGPIELAVCWIHTDAPDAPRIVAEALAPGARLVQVFGTRTWPLEHVPVHVAYRQVLLGSGGHRWLTHEEISAGVLAAVDADMPVRVVGERKGAGV